jgi:hypothetical protein
MATIPTPEESGRKILAFYGQRNIRPGEMLLVQNLNSWWIKSRERSEDLVAGIEWLGDKGYIETQDEKSNGALFLTDAGFAAI